MSNEEIIYPRDLPEKSYERILNEIETHTANAVKLMVKAHELQNSVLDIENLDEHIAKMKQAIKFQEFSIKEMQMAVELQKIYLERLNNAVRL